MALSERQAFKLGYIARCVEQGLGPGEILGRVKAAGAAETLGALGTGAFNKTTGLVKDVLGNYAIPAALGLPPLVGAAVGYGAARLSDVDDTDVDDVRKRETIREYMHEIQRLKHEREARRQRTARVAGGRSHF